MRSEIEIVANCFGSKMVAMSCPKFSNVILNLVLNYSRPVQCAFQVVKQLWRNFSMGS